MGKRIEAWIDNLDSESFEISRVLFSVRTIREPVADVPQPKGQSSGLCWRANPPLSVTIPSSTFRLSRRWRVLHCSRLGFTLLELVLVISIVIVVAAIAAPSIQRTFSRQAIQKGADRVRIAMGQARVRAIKTGQEHAVFYSPEGSWFNVAPFSEFAEQSELASRRQEKVVDGNFSNFEEDLLPRGVKFYAAQADVNSRAAAIISAGSSSTDDAVGMILFYPDGTSQDAKLLFENEDQLFVQLELRGLTGLARTVRVENPEDQ